MRQWLRRAASNLGLAVASLAVTLLLLEIVVFRHVLEPDDLLPNVSIDGVVRYQAGTQATFRHPDRTETRVSINADGWNSTKPAYSRDKTPGVLRVAVVGDSYVHASFVNVEQGFPEVIERELNRAGRAAEVYRFGMDGAPMSQYLHMIRREVARFRPDVVVVQLIHNDFDEAYRFLRTRYASSFLKIGLDTEGRAAELPPADFVAGPADALRNLATFRYLYYKTNAYLRLKSLISRLWWGGNEDWDPTYVQSGVDIRRIADHAKNRIAARYVLAAMRAEAEAHGFRLLIVMDGVREAVYAGRPAAGYEVGKLNAIAADATAELGLDFLDLQNVFATDYARNQRRFEFSFDWHWNALANELVGTAIAERLRRAE